MGMLFGGTPSAPPPPPPPANPPTIANAQVQGQGGNQKSRAAAAAGAMGFSDTAKTGPQGLADTITPVAKSMLGS